MVKIGDKIVSSVKNEVKKGFAMQLKYIPAGTLVHNIELTPGKGGISCTVCRIICFCNGTRQ